ncbi:hypothetical protein [Commensalibacter oyaizuii]|uniref:Uncharacterized protein n=1 Tax=Commensalibacter oyaizuii TaxID=3043873 RepID=A0ABT6Q3P3_9PROT|nr:hypothetical protein [Commensalibacter sp. TBRC 16381]MDI2091747.1 hypothetical protein [Commensalibacter sp. TBRC 16381]
MGIFGSMIILSIISYSAFIFFMKVIGASQGKELDTQERISKDTEEFNKF